MRNWASINRKKDITRIRSGVCIRTPYFIANFNASDHTVPRALIVASKKRIHRNAVVRNLAKRRMRAVLDILNYDRSVDINIILSKSIVTANFAALTKLFQCKYNEFVNKTLT